MRGRPGVGAGAGAGRRRWRLDIRRTTRRGGFLRFMSDVFVFVFVVGVRNSVLYILFPVFIATCDMSIPILAYFSPIYFSTISVTNLYVFCSTDQVLTPTPNRNT